MDAVWLTLRAVVAMAAVLALIWWAARRVGGARLTRGGSEPRVTVVDRTALGRHAGVAVLAVGNRRILVGFAEQQVSMLTELAPVIGGHDAPIPSPRLFSRPSTDVDRKLSLTPAESAQVRSGGLQGSILHPQTWKDTVRVLQDRTVRR